MVKAGETKEQVVHDIKLHLDDYIYNNHEVDITSKH